MGNTIILQSRNLHLATNFFEEVLYQV